MNMTRALFIMLFSMVVLSSCGAVKPFLKQGCGGLSFL